MTMGISLPNEIFNYLRMSLFTLRRLLPFLIILALTSSLPAQEKLTWSVYFSPKGGSTDAIIKELDNAKISILVQAYSFTSAPIAKALLISHKRGVKVEVILDKSQRTEKYSSADFLVNSGVPTKVDATHAIAHNKVMIIDGEIVTNGSFNFTRAAGEKNADNLLMIQNKDLAGRYAENWQKHARHSEVYAGKERYDPLLSS